MKYVLVTGFPNNDDTTQMEVMDKDGSTTICKAKYPLKVSGATGVVTNGKMVVCGGVDESGTRRTECYAFADDGKGWKKLADMATPRWGSGSIAIPNGILVIGGEDDEYNRLKTSEIIYLNKSVVQGKSIPEPRFASCIVNHQGENIVTGGEDENADDTSTVWLFNNHIEFTKEDLPEMNFARYNHACGIIQSNYHSNRPLLVVAGNGLGKGQKKSEFLDYTLTGAQWKSTSKLCIFKILELKSVFIMLEKKKFLQWSHSVKPT